METSKEFFCHTCKKTFQKVIMSEDEDIACALCADIFVEEIEDANHLVQLKNLYN